MEKYVLIGLIAVAVIAVCGICYYVYNKYKKGASKCEGDNCPLPKKEMSANCVGDVCTRPELERVEPVDNTSTISDDSSNDSA
jgi:hypothetical protein